MMHAVHIAVEVSRWDQKYVIKIVSDKGGQVSSFVRHAEEKTKRI